MSVLSKIDAFHSCFHWQILLGSEDENTKIIEYTYSVSGDTFMV